MRFVFVLSVLAAIGCGATDLSVVGSDYDKEEVAENIDELPIDGMMLLTLRLPRAALPYLGRSVTCRKSIERPAGRIRSEETGQLWG